jgi:hypothetical protein
MGQLRPGLGWLLALALVAPSALAQDDKEPGSSTESAEGAEGGESGDAAKADDEKKADDKKADDKKAEEEVPVGDDSPVEEPGQTYRFVGLRYRGVIIPKFMMNLFGEGGKTVYVHGIGPEFAIRKDAFEYVFSLWYAGYKMDDTPFKSSSDPATGWEIVKADLSVLYLTADFLWSQEMSPEFAINYGMGAGFGFVFGDLYRTQAYPTNGSANQDPYDWQKCVAPNNPPGGFCGTDNDHYPGYKEPSWANGGSKPIIFPWLAMQTGVRYKPTKKFVGRLDLGFGTSGFFIGLGADYGL